MLLLAVLIAASLHAPTFAFAQESHAIVVPDNQVVYGDLASLNQPIVVLGEVVGDVTSWSGSITVSGVVDGDVVSYVGQITLAAGAQVHGSVLALSSGVVQTADALVAGRVLGEEPLAAGVLIADMQAILRPQASTIPAQVPLPLITTAFTLLAFFFALACASLWPRRTIGIAWAVQRAPVISLTMGVLTTLLLVLLFIPLSGLLALSLLGLPLLLPLLVLLQVPYLFGLAALGRVLGERIYPAHNESYALGIALLLVPCGLLGAVAPLWAGALFYLASSIGLGATILSRGGAYALRVRRV